MPTQMERVEEHSNLYKYLKFYVDFCFRLYFRVSVKGVERLESEGTLIIAPNHQNALMDALAVLSVKQWQPVFLARADIFKNVTIRKILTFLKIMPVFRIRDGYSTLAQNDSTFRKTMDVLRNRNGLVILPEGNHGDQKRLRPLKKGIARIAFQAEDEANGKLDLRIIPVGLDYTHYINVGSQLHIRFGVPIRVAPILAQYRMNPAKGYNKLIGLLENGIKQEMVHIADEKYHNSIRNAIEALAKWELKRKGMPFTHENSVVVQQRAAINIEKLRINSPDEYLVLMALFMEYERDIKQLGATSTGFPMQPVEKFMFGPKALGLFILLPVFLFTFINNLLPLAAVAFNTRKVKDMQFLSSFRFGLAVLLFPVFHALQLVTFAILLPCGYCSLAYAVLLPVSVFLFFWWKRSYCATVQVGKVILAKYSKRGVYSRAKELHAKLMARLSML